MNKKEWQAIDQARELLKLGDKATLGEMKRAYHRMCKKYHPDGGTDIDPNGETMYRITAAYELLMRYTREYRFPLTPGEHDIYDAEDWWMDRFGQDPLWGKSKRRRR
jgi:preprotein translocase subunit Sec63